MQKLKIRRAEIGDLERLSGLFDDYRVFYGKLPDREGAKTFLFDRLRYEESVIFVAASAGDVLVGFVQLYPLFSSTRMDRLWLLNDLYVELRYRGKGVATQLIEATKQLCRQTGSCGLLLETAKDNDPANGLYLSTGFNLDVDHHYYTWNVE
ncbi:MAG: GNAT family N-acetyltransferase [Saprospiraceae bacterium]|nr:GNAT family N-acetyltransferase [Saprospiraceae bacterium]